MPTFVIFLRLAQELITCYYWNRHSGLPCFVVACACARARVYERACSCACVYVVYEVAFATVAGHLGCMLLNYCGYVRVFAQ